MEQGAASEEAGGSGKHWEKDSFHPTKAIARDQEKSTESISTRFLVGTALPSRPSAAVLHDGQTPLQERQSVYCFILLHTASIKSLPFKTG